MKQLARGRRTRGVVDWRPAFLAALTELGVITRAAKAADVDTITVWRHRRDDEGFRKQFEEAKQTGALLLEAEAIRRARDGVRRMKFNPKTGLPYIDPETKKPYVEHEYSDTLMLALLKSHFPQYHDKPADVNVSTVVHNHVTVARQKELQERRAAALSPVQREA